MRRQHRRASNIGLLCERAATRFGDQPIVLDRPLDLWPEAGATLSYARIAELVEEASGWLVAAGVRPGERVAIWKRNHFDLQVAACAAARAGAVPALLAAALPAEVVAVLLRRLEQPTLLCDRARLASWPAGLPPVGELARRVLAVEGGAGGEVPLDDLRGAPAPPPNPRDDDQPMVVTHTSGTTGLPKLVAHSAATIGALGAIESRPLPVLRLRRDDRVGLALSYAHGRVVTGLAALCAVGPSVQVLSDWEPEVARAVFGAARPTVLETHPNVYMYWEPLAAEPAGYFRDVRVFMNTFDAIHPRTVRTFLGASRERLAVWGQGWGQSEAGPVCGRIYTRRSVRDRGPRHPVTRSVGRPLPLLAKLRVIDQASGEPLPAGRVGLLEVATPGACLGYVGEPERFQTKRRDGWWNMGDLGMRTRVGTVLLLDREVDQIPGMSGIELEDVLLDRFPTASEIVVLGVPDGAPVPVVSTHGDVPLDRAAWGAAVTGLPLLADPVHLPWAEIPRTSTWKVRRPELKRRLFGEATTLGTGRWT
jgi:acyl-coenzyme A synthetase/AMP-(fatty) acid ligase